jgi:predicted esterase
LPLLIWLPRAGERPEDVALSWRLALGDQSAIAVVEPPIPEAQPDGRIARRWAYPTSFAQDAAPVELGLRRIVEYAARRLPIDPARIVIAGDGDGAATVLYGALYDDELAVVRIAAAPTLPRELQHAAIPDDDPAARDVLVLDPQPDRPAMANLVEGFTRSSRPTYARPSRMHWASRRSRRWAGNPRRSR